MRLFKIGAIVNVSIMILSKLRRKVTRSRFNVRLCNTLDQTLAYALPKKKCFRSCQKLNVFLIRNFPYSD